jgi:hypothetical protein
VDPWAVHQKTRDGDDRNLHEFHGFVLRICRKSPAGKISRARSIFRTQQFAIYHELGRFFTGKRFALRWRLKVSGGQQYEKLYVHLADGCDVAFLRTCIQPGFVWYPDWTAATSACCPRRSEAACSELRMGRRVLVSAREEIQMA